MELYPISSHPDSQRQLNQQPDQQSNAKSRSNLEDLLSGLPPLEKVLFEPLSMATPFSPTVYIPSTANILSPYSIFSLFIPENIYSTISTNTNIYALQKGAGLTSLHGRTWCDTTANEIKIFIAIVLYMGVHRSPRMEDYWSSTKKPHHLPADYMSQKRFEQIKRYLHISNPLCPSAISYEPKDPTDEATTDGLYLGQIWWNKIEPLASQFRAACTAYYTPSSTVSIDESMIRCHGRSQHIYKMPNKPIKQGYKLYGLADHGYMWYWLWASRTKSLVEVVIDKNPTLTKTGSMVLQLLRKLPTHSDGGVYTVYLDNYFTSIELFKQLRELGIGACGTTRPKSSKEFPKALAVLKDSKKPIPWNTLYAVPVDSVLCIARQDNNMVTALSTIHTVHQPSDWIERDRKRPAKTSTNPTITRKPFGDESVKKLSIPRLIDDYNHYMGGVDIPNQLRANYETHQKAWRSWWPLFYWCLDTAAVNAYHITNIIRVEKLKMAKIEQMDFRVHLYEELFEQGSKGILGKRKADTQTQNTEQYDHQVIRAPSRKACYWCRVEIHQKGLHTGLLKKQPAQTQFMCKACQVYLCKPGTRSCWQGFHKSKY
jgi:hypothetical protein